MVAYFAGEELKNRNVWETEDNHLILEKGDPKFINGENGVLMVEVNSMPDYESSKKSQDTDESIFKFYLKYSFFDSKKSNL